MEGYAEELDHVKEILKANPRGMTVTDMSKELKINRNSVAKYLDILLVSGHVEMRSFGPAKVYFLSQRIPVSALLNFSSDCMLVLDRNLKVIQVNDKFLDFTGLGKEDVLNKEVGDPSLLVSSYPEIMPKIMEALDGEEYAGVVSLPAAEKDFYFKIKLIPSTFEDGSPGVTLILEDITEEKRMEEALKKHRDHLEELVGERTEELKTINDNLQKEIEERRNAEDELRRSEELYRTLSERSLVGVLMIQDGRIVYANPMLTCEIGGCLLEDLLDHDPLEFVHPEDANMVAENIQARLVDREALSRFKFRIVRKDGEIRWLEVIGSWAEYNGKPSVLATLIDITDHLQAEQLLKRKLEIEQAVASISSMFVAPADIDVTIMDALGKSGELCGASRTYVFLFHENKTVMDNTHEWCSEGVEPQKDNLQELPLNMFPWWMNKLDQGEIIHITDVSALPPEASAEKEILEMQEILSLIVLPIYMRGKLAGFIGMDNVENAGEWRKDDLDILRLMSNVIGMAIERKRAEDKMANQKRFSQSLLESMNEGLVMMDFDFSHTYVNPAFCRMTGFSKEDLVDGKQPIPPYWPTNEAPGIIELFKNKIFKGMETGKDLELTLQKKGGEQIYCTINPAPVKDTDGNVIGWMMVVRDVTANRTGSPQL